MATPSYATDLNDIYLDQTTGWTTLSGRVTNPETDDYIQGNNCWSHDPFSSAIEGGIFNSSETIATDDAVFYWTKADVAQTLATKSSGGEQALIGSGTSAYDCFYINGSDTLTYGGWKCTPVDPTKTPSTTVGSPTSTTSYFGVRWNVPGSGASKGYPFKIDAMRHGRQIEVTAGDSSDPATWDKLSTYDSNSTRMWGICQPTDTGAAQQGIIYWGTASASVYSRDSNRAIVFLDTEWTVTDFTKLIFAHASNDVVWDNISLSALGTNNKGIIDITANGTITWSNSVFSDIGTTSLGGTNSTFTNNTWLGSGQITGNGATITGGTIRESTGSSALLVDTAAEMADITGVDFVDNNTGGTPTTATFYFDGSDAAAADSGSDWTNVTNADDGTTTTYASTSTASSSTLSVEGTNATAITTDQGGVQQVRARAYGYTSGAGDYDVQIYENGGTNALGGVDLPAITAGWGNYTTLTEPSGGWTSATLQALEFDATHGTGAFTMYVGRVEIEVTYNSGHSIELTAIGTHAFTDITFSGGGGTSGSNLVASSGSESADVYNNSGGAITINVTGGDQPSVRNAASSTTTVQQVVTLTVTVTDQNGNAISSPVVSIREQADNSEESQGTGTAGGIYTDSAYVYGGSELPVYVRVRKSTTGSTRYNPVVAPATITADGLNVSVTMTTDTIASS